MALLSAFACMPSGAQTPIADMTEGALTKASESMSTHVEVEFDIFSGMPNPTWILSPELAQSFETRLAALPRAPPGTMAGHLGYRGFLLRVTQNADTRLIHVQRGIVRVAHGPTTLYARDENRNLERWLLETGKPFLKSELFEIAEREIR